MKPFLLSLLVMGAPAFADPAEVVQAQAKKTGGTWRFDVTILHADSGWDHYVDGWVVLAPDGTKLGSRPLAHPHENEQPFTRSVSGISIPAGLDHVFIVGNCNVDGQTAKPTRVNLN